MAIHAIICTRSREDISEVTDKLLTFLSRCKINVFLISRAESIFKAYQRGFGYANPAEEDIVIFCHDDIEIREEPEEFVAKLEAMFTESTTRGFVGAAGTTHLGETAVWWERTLWEARKHRGRVSHITPEGVEYWTDYTPNKCPTREVVVLDGLFLAATPKCIEAVGLEKPEYFTGEWDFYDIHYTSKAHDLGFVNKVMDFNILHHSRGELVGRDSWHENREAFIANTELPLIWNDVYST